MKQVLAAFARNTVFANIVLILIFLAGLMATQYMIREIFPEFSLDMIQITTVYPGADPEEVEEAISRKIEDAIEGIEGIKLFTTYSGENSGTTMIEVHEDYDSDIVLDRVRTKVGSISNFPEDVEKPIISELTVKHEVMMLYISGNMPERRLKEWAEALRDEIKKLENVSQVEVYGARAYEINIEVSEERLREYGLNFNTVSNAIRQSNLNLAGGIIKTTGEEIRVRTVGRKYTGEELASIAVVTRSSGEIITLEQLAKIDDGFNEDPVSAMVNGESSLLLYIYKTKEEDAITISDAIKSFVKEKQKQLPEGMNLDIVYDITSLLKARINLLIKNGIIGLMVVYLLLWAFLNARLSFWAGMGIPISIAGALVILWSLGGTINMISLFGFILVLGIVVDDAIVVGEAIYYHRKKGKLPIQAVVDGVSEVGMPVVAAVITTIVTFVPILFVGGIMGKFISIMPVVVIACLAVSLIECLILLPAHLSHLPDPNKNDKQLNVLTRRLEAVHYWTSQGMEWFVENAYKPFLSKALYWRYISLSIAISTLLITIGLVAGGILKYENMPDIDGYIIISQLEFPEGTPPEITKKAVQKIDSALMQMAQKTKTRSGKPLVNNRLALVGQTLDQIPKFGPHRGSVMAILLESEERGIHTKDLMVQWQKEIGPIPGIKSLTFIGMQSGPPGDPIEIWLQSQNMEDIIAAADELSERLKQFDGVYQIRSDFSPGKNEMRLSLKPEATTIGLTVEDLARQIRSGYYGDEAVRLQRGRDDIRVKVRYTTDERSRLSDIEHVRIKTKTGKEVPLTSVADIYFSSGYSTIIRTDGMRRITVSAALDTNKGNANEILNKLASDYYPHLTNKYSGLFVNAQGEKKKMRESFSSLGIGYPLAMVAIFIIVATMFRSYAQPFVILFTVPFGIIGGIFGHLLLGYNLSMISTFGMVGLTGIVVNDAIVLIERINENIARGMPFFESILNGGARRFRAIILTSMSTVGGLTPMILETDLQARFLIPMAISIAAGVIFATVLTLVLVPSLLAILSDFRLLFHRIRHRNWPKRVDVEPARDRHIDPLSGKSDIKHGDQLTETI